MFNPKVLKSVYNSLFPIKLIILAKSCCCYGIPVVDFLYISVPLWARGQDAFLVICKSRVQAPPGTSMVSLLKVKHCQNNNYEHIGPILKKLALFQWQML